MRAWSAARLSWLHRRRKKYSPSKTPGIFVKFVKDKSGQLANRMILLGEDGAPGTIRTPDPQIDVAVRFRGVGIARPNGAEGLRRASLRSLAVEPPDYAAGAFFAAAQVVFKLQMRGSADT
jgi:hypothetical protein